MSEGPSPYIPPAISLSMPPYPPVQVPGRVKVFGILHLVFAGLGVVTLAFSAAAQGFSRSMYAAQERAGGAQAEQAKISRAMTESMQGLTFFQYGVSGILAVLLLVAGIGLLKSRQGGL